MYPEASCPDAPGISAYFDGELPPGEALRMEEHLAVCPACRASLKLFRSQRALLHEGDVPLSSKKQLWDDFWTYAGRARVRRFRPVRSIAVPLPLAAAAVLLLVAAVVMNFILPAHRRGPEVLVLETMPQAAPVLSLSIPPQDLEKLLAVLEVVQPAGEENLQVLPAELPFVRLGEPQIGRNAVEEF